MAPLGAGLISNVQNVIKHVEYAREKNYYPVVDMQNYLTFYNEMEPIRNKFNSWEYYFNQPSEVSLEDAYHSKKVILSKGYRFRYNSKKINLVNNSLKSIIDTWSCDEIYLNSYVNYEHKKMVNAMFAGKKVVGISVRGTDYLIGVKFHHKQPTLSELYDLLDEYLVSKADFIFLSTEDDSILSEFKKRYNEKLLFTSRERISNYNDAIPTPAYSFSRKNDNYLKGLEYLIDVLLLSSCDFLVGAYHGATWGALYFSQGKFRGIQLIDKGMS